MENIANYEEIDRADYLNIKGRKRHPSTIG